MKRIFVGNLSYSAKEDEIAELFSQFGDVSSVKFINDRETGRFRGFGFVEMDGSRVSEAIDTLNDSIFGGRTIRVNEAHERERVERRPRS